MAMLPTWLMLIILTAPPVRAEGPPPPPTPEPAATAEPLSNAVKGLELPAPLEVDPREGYVHVRPKWEADGQVLQVEWSVTATGEVPPKYTDLGTEGLILGVPQPDEQVLIHAAALIQPADPAGKPWMTRIARTVVTGRSAAPAPVPVGSRAPGPSGASQGLSVVLVFDAATAPAELTGLIQSPTLKAAIERSGSRFFAYDKGSPVLVSQKIKPVVDRAKALPVLVLIGPGGKQVLPAGEAVPLPLTGNAATTEAVLLGLVAGAGG